MTIMIIVEFAKSEQKLEKIVRAQNNVHILLGVIVTQTPVLVYLSITVVLDRVSNESTQVKTV